MDIKKICPECCQEVQMEVRKVQETYPVKGDPTTIDANVMYCCSCGESIFTMELDKDNLLRAFKKYEEKHNIQNINEER